MADQVRVGYHVLFVLLACSVGLNVLLLLERGSLEQSGNGPVIPTSDQAAAVDSARPEPAPTDEAAQRAASLEAAPTDAAATEWTLLSAEVEHSLARTFQQAAGDAGDALANVYSRLFVWDVDLRRDLRAGDGIAVIWREGSDGLPEIAAAALSSGKLGRTIVAYGWQAPGDPYPSYWQLDGTEVPRRLVDGPIEGYEQVTSLLKDRPAHKGMDFKTPVGTEVISPRAGKVTRANWNWKANGNCIEILYDDGVLAKFLHLNENRVKSGDRVRAGQVVALTGNTGHSTAPHLHYQLDRGDKTLDPLDYHGTVQRSLDAEQRAALQRDVAEYEAMLAGAAAP